MACTVLCGWMCCVLNITLTQVGTVVCMVVVIRPGLSV